MKKLIAYRMFVFVGIGFALMSILSGCGGAAQVELADLGELSGIVTYQGNPVPYGAIKFYKDKTLTCVATIEKDGSYRTFLISGNFTVAIDTKIEPRDAAKMVKEGPENLIGTAGGRLPVRVKADGIPEKTFDEYGRMPTLQSVLEKLTPANRSTLEAVHKQFGDAEKSGLTLKVKAGPITQNFELN